MRVVLSVGAFSTAALLSGLACASHTRVVTVRVLRTVTSPPAAAPYPEPRKAYAPAPLTGLAPLNAFVPQDARPEQGLFAPRAAGIPQQVIVEWGRSRMPGDGFSDDHVSLWEYVSGDQWRRIWTSRAPELYDVELAVGDATGDGHDEFLVGFATGSGDCGPRVLLTATVRVRTIFHSNTCDTHYTIGHGRLIVDAASYTAHDSHCCPTFTRMTVFSWEGARFVPARTALFYNCIEKTCLKWPRRPLSFAPSETRYWNSIRGVAVGGARPWLIATTRDGGRSWHIVDAAPCPPGPIHILSAGRATIRFRCRSRLARATTRNYGASWSVR